MAGLKVKSTAPASFHPEMSSAKGVGFVTQMYSCNWLPPEGFVSTEKMRMAALSGWLSGMPALSVLLMPMGLATLVTLCVPLKWIRRRLMNSLNSSLIALVSGLLDAVHVE